MIDRLFSFFQSSQNLNEFLLNFAVTMVLAVIYAWSVRLFAVERHRIRSFSASLAGLTLGMAVIASVINSNIGVALALIGTLSIVRYRSVLPGVEQLTYSFLAIGLGLTSGTGNFVVGGMVVTAVIVFNFASKQLREMRPSKLEVEVLFPGDVSPVIPLTARDEFSARLMEYDRRLSEARILFEVKLRNISDLDRLRESIRSHSPKAQILIRDADQG